MTTEKTGAPTDVTGGMPATDAGDAATALTDEERATLAAIADHLIPAAHGMPSAADIVTDDRLRFVLGARPDLAEPLKAALRPELGSDVADRLATLADEPTNVSALQLTIVSGYYTDKRVREQIGYPGQIALDIRAWEVPAYLDEGLIDAVLARGPVWRDPATGQRAVATTDAPRTYADRWAASAGAAGAGIANAEAANAEAASAESPEGGHDGRDRT